MADADPEPADVDDADDLDDGYDDDDEDLDDDDLDDEDEREGLVTLSDAIRLGAMWKPQFYGDLWNGDGSKSCALGAAYDALGYGHGVIMRDLPERLERWLDLYVACPVCAANVTEEGWHIRTGEMIAHLNDGHRWTREEIADWIETLEPPDIATLDESAAVDASDPHAASPGNLTPRVKELSSSF
jgi:hypothetical protein